MVLQNEPEPINWPDLFSIARSRANRLKHETLADLMGISAAQLSQQLGGQGHLSLFRLAQVVSDRDGKEFLSELLALLAEEFGLDECDPVARTVAQSLQAISGVVESLGRIHFRMARAELKETESSERKRA